MKIDNPLTSILSPLGRGEGEGKGLFSEQQETGQIEGPSITGMKMKRRR
jgi:hypothetical protein